MKFFPHEDFYIITELKPAEVQARLENEVEPNKGFSFSNMFSRSDRSFSGYVVNGTFEFKRIISYRNSFLPEIKGSTEPWMNGSRVHVKMSMHIAVTIFMCIWLGFALIAGAAILVQESSKGTVKIVEFVPFLMFAFGYALATGGFRFESIKAKNMLLQILNGTIEQ